MADVDLPPGAAGPGQLPSVRTKHGELSLAEIADLLPGTGDVMSEVGRLYGSLWFAATGGNWPLAAFFYRRTRARLRALAVLRPKYRNHLERFEREQLDPLMEAIAVRDSGRFRQLYEAAVLRVNELHVETGYPYLRWRRPEQPPDPGLDYGPGDPAAP